MSLLILGGTNDAFGLAERLHQKGVPIIYSLAGLVREPKVSYPVVRGGFSKHGGLPRYIIDNNVVAILDATHPYANAISTTAFDAAQKTDIRYWQFDRPMWQKQDDDQWFEYHDWNELILMLNEKKSVFITTGRLDQHTLTLLSTKLEAQLTIRTAIKPDESLDTKINWVHAIGPFHPDDEISLMQQYGIDALVSKNSGGHATLAKLYAARQLGVPAYLLKRPNSKRAVQHIFSNLEQCENSVLAYFTNA